MTSRDDRLLFNCKYRLAPIVMFSVDARSPACGRGANYALRESASCHGLLDAMIIARGTHGQMKARVVCTAEPIATTRVPSVTNFHSPLCGKRFVTRSARSIWKDRQVQYFRRVYTIARGEKRHALKDNFSSFARSRVMWERKRHWRGL